ncbi:hypothetical protein ABPG77_007342 [Micractinium sp. CCAP 211/92]
MPPRRDSTVGCSAKPAATGWAPTTAPPEPPEEEVLGRPVLKDFVDEVTKKIRAFKGYVRRRYKSDGSWLVLYEDGDREDLEWQALWPLISRGEAAGLPRHDPRTGKVAKPADTSGRQRVAGKPDAAAVGRGRAASPAAEAAAGRRRSGGGGGQSPQQLKAPAAEKEAAPAKKAARLAHESLPQKHLQKAISVVVIEQAEPHAKKRAQPPKQRLEQQQAAKSPASTRQSPKLTGPAVTAAAAAPPDKHGKQQADVGKGRSSVAAIKKRKEPGEGGASGGGSEAKKKRTGAPSGPIVDLPEPKMGAKHVYEYKRGEEPWRTAAGFSWQVYDEADVGAEATKRIRSLQREFNKLLIQVRLPETAFVVCRLAGSSVEAEEGGENGSEDGDNAAVAESKFSSGNDTKKIAGHFPGWPVGSRAYSRAELGCLGFHFPPIAGIDFVQAGKAGRGAPSFATSVMVSGWYQDDKDDGVEMWYTGEGGNALLNERKQVKDQALVRGNKALVGNIQLGIPVRVTRKQKDSAAAYGTAYIYDGLVVSYRYTKGIEGFGVYQYLLRRRPGQGKLLSQRVRWGGMSAPRKTVAENRPGVVVLDITKGQEEKGIPAVDDTWLASKHDDRQPQGDIPNCAALEDVVEESKLKGQIRGANQKRLEQLAAQGHKPAVQYIGKEEFVGKAARTVAGLKKAELPGEYASNPHAYLKKLNHGQLPYTSSGQLFGLRPVIYECGPWARCSYGKDCPQAVSQRGIRFRLELFKTSNGCGWGVRSWDMIPQHSFICLYVAQIYDAEEHEKLVATVEEQDAEYTFDLVPRPDVDWDGSEIPARELDGQRRVHFVACGMRKRNIGAWFNHSCAPNCFVQPLLDCHHDERCPKIGIFAMDNIAPMTELTIDYGEDYAKGFVGGCKCGVAECISRRTRGAQA